MPALKFDCHFLILPCLLEGYLYSPVEIAMSTDKECLSVNNIFVGKQQRLYFETGHMCKSIYNPPRGKIFETSFLVEMELYKFWRNFPTSLLVNQVVY